MLQADIIINAPPRKVREILLDFPKLRTWHDGSLFAWVHVIAPVDQKTGMGLKVGDKVKVGVSGMAFPGVIMDNESGLFSWIGPIPSILTGHHYFRFTPDPSDNNHTLFSQSETFGGLLGFTSIFFASKTLDNWKKFNKELKTAAEAKWAVGRDSSR